MQRLLLVLAVLILLAAMAARTAWAQQSEARVALLIGNAAYPQADPPLSEPVSDAKALAEELRRQGFDVEVGENLSKEAMQRALERFYGKITPTTALIFFSGYGIQSNRQNYLIPINAQIWNEQDVRSDGFPLDAVMEQLKVKGARVKIVILDASRRNPYERHFRKYSQGLGPITVPNGTAFMCSANQGTLMEAEKPGLFVAELIKKMRSPGSTVEDVFKRTRMDVLRGSNSKQAPWYSSTLEEEVVAIYTRGQIYAKDAEALNNRCWARAITGDLSGAQKDCNEALRLRPRYADAYDSRGLVHLKRGSFKEAVIDYDTALGTNPNQASSLYGRGLAKRRNGDSAGGDRDIDAAKDIQSDIVDEFFWYAVR
jgi:uncharacterized caspase-like protein